VRTENKLCVVASDDDRYEQAKQFADTNDIPLFDEANSDYELQLCFDKQRIRLFDTALDTDIHVDFVEGALAHREKFGGGKNQPLARAIGLNRRQDLTVVDATTGLARDAYILATLGCRLTLIEQSPVLYILVQDAIERARQENSPNATSNFIELINTDSLQFLDSIESNAKPDIIYIDPMYPERNKSALVKKDMQILHRLIGQRNDEASLLESAIHHAGYRVVVKRPSHAEPLAGIQPNTSISSKKTRYDIYSIKKL